MLNEFCVVLVVPPLITGKPPAKDSLGVILAILADTAFCIFDMTSSTFSRKTPAKILGCRLAVVEEPRRDLQPHSFQLVRPILNLFVGFLFV